MKESWSWEEVKLAELGSYNKFRLLYERFCRHGPIGLITHLDAMSEVVLLNVLAPKDAAFWSVCRPSLTVANGAYIGEQGFLNDPVIKRAFQRDLRLAGVRQTDPSFHLFRGLECLMSGKRNVVPWFDGASLGSTYRHRFSSFAFREDVLPRVRAFLESEAAQFGDLAFFAVDNRVGLYWSDNHAELRDPWQYLFRRWRLPGFDSDARALWWRDLDQRLAYAVEMASAGAVFDVPLPMQHIVSPGLSFFLGTEMVGGVDEVSEPVCRSILSHRARLVHLLGWPAFYDDVCRTLAQSSEGEPRTIDTYGCLEPYDIVTELEEYKREMERRYPCLLENPLRD